MIAATTRQQNLRRLPAFARSQSVIFCNAPIGEKNNTPHPPTPISNHKTSAQMGANLVSAI